jgi:hypothetical protein
MFTDVASNIIQDCFTIHITKRAKWIQNCSDTYFYVLINANTDINTSCISEYEKKQKYVANIVQIMLENGCDVNMKLNLSMSKTLLEYSVYNTNLYLFSLIIKYNCKITNDINKILKESMKWYYCQPQNNIDKNIIINYKEVFLIMYKILLLKGIEPIDSSDLEFKNIYINLLKNEIGNVINLILNYDVLQIIYYYLL